MLAKLFHPIPVTKDKTLFLYVLYSFIHGLYPISVIIALYFLAKGLSYADIGIVFGVFSVSGFLFEIPTGFFGDKYGRRASVIMGLLIMAVTTIIWTFISSTLSFTILAIVWMLGKSFISGSLGAYIYDYLDDKKNTKIYDVLIAKSGSVSYFAAAIGSIIGAFLFSINMNYPYYLLFFIFLLSAFTVYLMEPEKKISKSMVDIELNAFSGLKHVFNSKSLILVTLFVSLLFGFYGYYVHSVDKPYFLSLELFDVKWLGVFVALTYLVKSVFISQFSKIKESLSEFGVITLSFIIFAVGLLGMSKLFGVLGLLSAVIFYSSEPLREAIINSFSQKHIPSKIRATTLSSIKVYQSFFAALLGFAAGYVFDIFSMREGLFIAFVYSVVVYGFIYGYKKVRKIDLA